MREIISSYFFSIYSINDFFISVYSSLLNLDLKYFNQLLRGICLLKMLNYMRKLYNKSGNIKYLVEEIYFHRF